MKFKNLMLLFVLGFSIILINGCKDNSTNPTDDPAAYFMFKAGNYWVYNTDSLDANQAVVPGTTTTDSTVDVGVETKSGKSANKLTNYSSGGTNEDSYFALEGSKLYSLISDVSGGGVSLPISGWMLVADFNGTTWTVLDSNISQDMGMGVLNAKLTVKGSKGSQKSLTVGTSSVSCQEFIQTITLAGKLTISGIPIPIDINLTINVHYFFGKNVGLVQVNQETTKLTIPGLGDQVIPGFIQKLIRYKAS